MLSALCNAWNESDTFTDCASEFLVPLTSHKAGHLLDINLISNAGSCGTHVDSHVGEGQELTTIVSELCVDPQQALVCGEVPEEASFGIVCTIHLAYVNESCESVHLLTDIACTKDMAGVARSTSWC